MDRLAQLDKEVWQVVREEFEDVDEDDAVASAVVEVLGALRGSLDDLNGTSRTTAEGLAGVLGQVVGIVQESQTALVDAAKLTDGARVADAVAQLEKCVEEDGAKTRKAIQGVAFAMTEMSRKLDALAAIMSAPKRIVTDAQGRPIGVETVMNGNG